MFKHITILLILITANCLALNPGVNGFIKTSYLTEAKNVFWPKIQDALSNISTDEVFKVSTFLGDISLENQALNLELDGENVVLSVDQDEGVIRQNTSNVLLTGDAHWVLGILFGLNGGQNLTGYITELAITVKVNTQQGENGLIPLVNFESFTFLAPVINISVTNNILAPVINYMIQPLQLIITGILNGLLNIDGLILPAINSLANDALKQYYPTSLPINDFGIAISTYITGDVAYYQNGIQIPIEGLTYNIASGYKNYENCKVINDPKDPNTITDDLHLSLGECTIRTAIDALVESKYTTNVHIESPTTMDVDITLTQWDQETVEFSDGHLQLGLGLMVKGKLQSFEMTATTNALADLTIVKRNGLKKMCKSNVHSRFLHFAKKSCDLYSEDFKEKFPLLHQEEIIATYDLSVKFLKLDDLHITGIPDLMVDLFKKLFMGHTIEQVINLPQICIADAICLTELDAVLNQGYISVDANTVLKPLIQKALFK